MKFRETSEYLWFRLLKFRNFLGQDGTQLVALVWCCSVRSVLFQQGSQVFVLRVAKTWTAIRITLEGLDFAVKITSPQSQIFG